MFISFSEVKKFYKNATITHSDGKKLLFFVFNNTNNIF